MKYSDLAATLIGEGYRNCMPVRNQNALIDGPSSDREFAENDVICACGGKCRYEPWSQEGSYRAFAVCNTCDQAIEF